MDNKKIKVSGTGCALVDFVYVNADFNGLAFRKYTSQLVGDGGLSPGKLVFVDELEKFANKSYSEILHEINSEDYNDNNSVDASKVLTTSWNNLVLKYSVKPKAIVAE